MTDVNDTLVLPASYDGTDLLTLVSGQVRWAIRCISGYYEPWEPRGLDRVVPTAHGQRPGPRKRHQLPIELFGPVMGVGASETLARVDLHDSLRALRTLFAPEREPADLVLTLPGGGTATISCRPPAPFMAGDDSIPTYREVSIALVAVEDDWAVTGS